MNFAIDEDCNEKKYICFYKQMVEFIDFY